MSRGRAPGSAALFGLVLVGYGIGATLAWWVADTSGMGAVLFAPAGVTVVALLCTPRSRWWVVYLAAALAELTVDLGLGGAGPWTALGLVAANLAEPTVGALVVRATIPDLADGRIDLARRAHLWRFLGGAVGLAAAVGATIGATVLAAGDGVDLVTTWGQWWLGDALGIALVGSLLLVWQASPDLRPPDHPLAVGLVGAAVVLTAALLLPTDMPVLFVVLIGVIVAGAQFGCRTVAVVSCSITLVVVSAFADDPDGLILDLGAQTGLEIVKLQLLLFVVAGLIVAAEAHERALAASRAAAEHRTVERLQRLLLPPERLEDEHFGAVGVYRAAVDDVGVGGDWYDVFTLADGRVLATVGDIVGHDLEAARAMSGVRSLLPAFAERARTAADVLRQLDELAGSVPAVRFATCWVGLFEPASRCLDYASAGHPPGFLVDPRGRPSRLEGALSPPLAVTGGGPRTDASIRVCPGAALVLYTDGLIERRFEGVDRGLDRLTEELSRWPRPGPEEVVDALLADSAHNDDTILLWVTLAAVDEPPRGDGRRPLAGQMRRPAPSQ